MKRKILMMGIICLFLLTNLSALSAVNTDTEKKEVSSSNDSWITITSPLNGSKHFGIVLLSCKASPDVDYVRYYLTTDWKNNGHRYLFGPWDDLHINNSNFQKLWIWPHVRGTQEVTIEAWGYHCHINEDGGECSWVVAQAHPITIYRRF